MKSIPRHDTSHPAPRTSPFSNALFLPCPGHRIQAGLRILVLPLLVGALLAACPKPSAQGTMARPTGPKKLGLTFTKGWSQTYQAKILFQARMDQLGTKESSKHTFLATFSVNRKVTSLDKERACFNDRFTGARVRIDNLPPRVTEAVAKELDSTEVSWCLDTNGRLSLFSVQGMGPALEGLKLSSVLSRIYHMAASASAQDKSLGDEWKQTTTNHQVIGGKKVQTDIQTDYAVMQSENCRPSPLESDGKNRSTQPTQSKGLHQNARPRSLSRSKSAGHCLEVLVTERGVIPDFELTKGQKSFKMGGVIKGKASILVDSNRGTWRAWAIRRVVGIAATTKVRGASTDFGMRTDVLFVLATKGR